MKPGGTKNSFIYGQRNLVPCESGTADIKYVERTKHALERNFSIIGEAVARIDKSFKDQYPSVDWREVKNFRNLIVHDYFGIDDTIVCE